MIHSDPVCMSLTVRHVNNVDVGRVNSDSQLQCLSITVDEILIVSKVGGFTRGMWWWWTIGGGRRMMWDGNWVKQCGGGGYLVWVK